ncbi:MAG: hypothetical protein HZB56_01835 [Deltaproteobacteria bacterium]|nr:hypothetical protein [Deltaproteobacteria bacterium]
MSSPTAPRRGLASRLLQRLGSTLLLFVRPFSISFVAVLLAIARGLAGPRYRPPHTPQNLPTEVERKR